MHNLKQIIRGLWRYKNFTIINFLGLSFGIAAIVILYLIFSYEKSFDKLHADSDKIYRVVSQKEREGSINEEAGVPYPTAKLFRNEFSDALATQISFDRERTIKIGEQSPFIEKNIVFGDSLFFKVMNFSKIKNFWISGNPERIFDAPNKAVLTETTSKRYFGNADPIGKTFKLDNKADIEVVGLVKDVPSSTHLPVNLFISYTTLNKTLMGGLSLDNWDFTGSGYCYIKLRDENARPSVDNALTVVVQKNAKDDRGKKQKLFLQNITAIHFDPTYETSNPNYTVSDQYLKMLLLLGAFIILIACINYINLSTSLAFTKAKEVGIRKTIGASKKQLFFHYISETVLVTSIAAIIGIAIATTLLPLVNKMLDKSITATQLLDLKFAAIGIVFILIISLLSGVYPALILSGFKPIISLKSQFNLPARSSALFRKGLVVFQFTISITLIICTIVIAKQVKYFNNKSLGFNKDAVIEVGLPDSDSARIESFKAQLQNQSGISSVSFCLGAPVSDNGINTRLEAPELASNIDYNIQIIACDNNYLKTYGLKLAAGRWFLSGEEKNLESAIIINETTVKTLGYKKVEEAIGKKIRIGINEMNPTVIGVVNDFHFSSLHKAITPAGLMPFPPFYFAAGIRIEPGAIKNTLAKIESVYKKVYANDVYKFSFIDETLSRRYEREIKDYNLFKAFSVISIFICCIGLWGLIAFVVVRKTKEIGIRKVLGASVAGIVQLLSKDFLKLIAIAIIIASPVAWYFMHNWLQDFAYRINISWWVFAVAGSFAVVIALITISFQAIKAAIANPVKSLRTE
jgi:ABC-type antimicrobial peptide transport system permease subunit